MITIKPEEDGIFHINIYSKGVTEIGRLLSHFAYSPFIHPVYGKFLSLESFWYYLSTGCLHESLKTAIGFKAKQEGRKYPRVKCENFWEQIKDANKMKLEQNPYIAELLKQSTLPFEHYYVVHYGVKVIVPNESKPFVEMFESLRQEIKGSS